MIALAADIGGTRIKLGIVRDQRLLSQDSIEARSAQGLQPQLARIAQTFADLARGTDIRYEDCAAVSVAFPSLVDVAAGRALNSYGKYPDAPRIDLPGWARETFGLPLVIDNDARVAQLGEWRAGAGRGCDDFVMLTVGTGLGTSALIDGRLLRGKHGEGGILGGHMTVRQGGRPCICGNRGCAEAEASTAVLPQIAREHKEFASSALSAVEVIDYPTVFKLARKGDACAAALRSHSLDVWSALLVNLIRVYDPERIVVGGGVIGGAPDCVAALEERVHACVRSPWGRVEIVPAQLGDAAALIGAGCLVQEQGEAPPT
jgi:glucokinase